MTLNKTIAALTLALALTAISKPPSKSHHVSQSTIKCNSDGPAFFEDGSNDKTKHANDYINHTAAKINIHIRELADYMGNN